MGCARCHEIRPDGRRLGALEPPRASSCKDCHGSSFSADLRMHAKNLAARVAALARRGAGADPHPAPGRRPARRALRRLPPPGARRLGRAGPTARRTRRSSSNPEHNANQQLMDDCLRCHAMHFEGGIRDLVTPLDRKGPWTFVTRPSTRACRRCPASPATPSTARASRSPPAQRPPARGRARSRRSRGRRSPSTTGAPRARRPRPAADAGDARRRAAGEDEPRPPAGALLPVPRAAGREPGLLRRRPHAGRRPRGPELPRLPREARPDDARLVRRLPPAPLELRHRRGDDGHDLQVPGQPARRPPRGLPRLPPEGRAEGSALRQDR